MKKRVLLIEDRNVVLTGMKDSITKKSKTKLEIDAATSFYEANNLLEKHEYDIVVLDLNMAGISSEECFNDLPGTTLNGWIFLRRYFFGKDAPYKEKCENTKVVIYSGFTKELREHIKKLPLANEERQWFKKVELVGKVSGEYKTVTNKIIGFLNDD